MSEIPPKDSIEAIAASIFSCHGVDFATVRRAGGWTNAVWMADELVLRLSTRSDNKSLLNESNLSSFFPAEVGYPELVGSGITAGHAWTLAKKLPGRCLGEVWETLSLEERVDALQGLWARAEAVHSIDCGRITTVVPRRAWFNSNNPEEAEASVARLAEEKVLTQDEASALLQTLGRFWQALADTPAVLCHGDLTLDNVMWNEGGVTALLDFEFAVMAPIYLDLNHLVKSVFGPDHLERDPSPQDNQGTGPLRRAVKEIALPLLHQPAGKVLLAGYAILLELWLLETWLAHPEGEGPLEMWEPLLRLRSLADGNDGYLRQLA